MSDRQQEFGVHLVTPLVVAWLIGAGTVFLLVSVLDAGLAWDWFRREGDVVFVWWLLTTLAGAAVMPLFFRLLPGLPSRGYAVARTGGVMLTGFIFWLGASLFGIQNTPGAIVLAWLLVLMISVAVWRRGAERPSARSWFSQNWTMIVVVEMVFLALLFGWAVFRAHEPDVRTTEKPMEMMFVNSIRQSETFPPNDGWLAGYSISYYYFGYVITAGLADLSGVNTGIAFGLIGPMLMALAGIGVLGIVYDLVRLREGQSGRHGAIWVGLLGVIFLLFMGNLGTFFVEQPWNGRGVLGRLASPAYFEFWGVPERSRLAIRLDDGLWKIPGEGRTVSELPEGYVVARDENGNFVPDWDEGQRDYENWDYWWWFRYSRVIEDRFLNGDPIGVQPIAEEPHFSFILADIHPHVLSLPFTILAITLAAGLALGGRPLEWWGYGLYVVWVGGMIFMNSWDAVFIPFVIAAEAMRRLIQNKTGRFAPGDIWGIIRFALIVGVLTLVFYLPWIISFTSQAGGIYFNIIWPTSSQQFFLQFGAFGILMGPFLLVTAWRARRQLPWQKMALAFLVLFLLINVGVPFMMAGVYHGLCQLSDNPFSSACNARGILFGGVNPAQDGGFWFDLLARRATGFVSEGLILAGLVFIGFYLFRRPQTHTPNKLPFHSASGFAMLVMAAGLVLVLMPDFVYLIDNFHVRINTVFKLYYQGWIFFSVAAAYSVYGTLSGLTAVLISRPDESGPVVYPPPVNWRFVYVVIIGVVLFVGLTYPYYAIRTRALVEPGRLGSASDADLTLDGRPGAVGTDEFAVAQCLLDLNPDADAVVAEAPFNGGYNVTYGRIAMLTGVPNLLGWINHEGQWRGPTFDRVTEVVRGENGAIIDSREMQVDRLYQTDDWNVALSVIRRYGIAYVMVGGAERQRYADSPDGLEKFAEYLVPVCESGSAVLYQVGG